MADSDQQPIKVTDPNALLRVVSRPRFQTYMTAAGHDLDRAWRLYIWNARLGEAFHFPIQTAEVGLRNCIDATLTQVFGPNWGTAPQFESHIDDRSRDDIAAVKKRIKNRNQKLENGQIVAGLSFGFWVQMLHKRHYPTIWSQHLSLGFPHLPSHVDLKALHGRAGSVNKLRNRISHHEPLIRSNVSQQHAELLELLGWICPETLALCRPHFRVPTVMRQKP